MGESKIRGIGNRMRRRRKDADAGGRGWGALRIEAGRGWSTRIGVVSQAYDEHRAALSGDPAIRNAVSPDDQHFYFYLAVSAFCSLLCPRFLLLSWGKRAAKKAGDACIPMLSSTVGTNSRACLSLLFPIPASPRLSTRFSPMFRSGYKV